MSMMSNSTSFMAQATRNGAAERETFHKFFECWIAEQNQHLQELVSASKEHERSYHQQQEQQQEGEQRNLRSLLERVIQHYELYYRSKLRWARTDVLSMFNPTWTSSLEDAFMWIGGWRPSMAFHLLYSKSGQQFEAGFEALLQGINTGDLGDLSTTQLEQVNSLQKETIREEKEISEKLAVHQETIADPSMVELSHIVTELVREGDVERVMDDSRVDATLAPKEEGLVIIIEKADELRLNTLKRIIEILTPTQGVYFMIAAAELHLRLHEWGKRRDARHNRNQ